MEKVCDKYCQGCIFYGGWMEYTACCNYILITDKRRGCDPGRGCVRKIKRRRRKNGQLGENRCVCCSVIIPEGRKICPMCERGIANG